MNLNCLVLFIFILSIRKSSADHQVESCQASKEADGQCGSYTYEVVKPLLNYVKQLKSELDNNNSKQLITDKDQEIKELKENLHKCNANEINFKELRDQIEFQRKIIEQLISSQQSIKVDVRDQIKKFANEGNVRNLSEQIDSQNCKISAKYESFTQEQKHELEKQIKSKQEIINKKDQTIIKCQNDVKKCKNKLKNKTSNPQLPLPRPNDHYSYCNEELSEPGWIIIQQRIKGGVDFHKNWLEYRNGFGTYNGDFFLGLEQIHLLTSSEPHKLCIHMEDFDGVVKYASYDQFAIADEQDYYRLITLSDATGNATYDNLKIHKNQPFSTYDNDHDNMDNHNCADSRHHAGGWWYNDCGHSNLNGRYSSMKFCRNDLIYWDDNVSLKTVKMLIRPVDPAETDYL